MQMEQARAVLERLLEHYNQMEVIVRLNA
jgi:hypothetical protein